MKLHEIIARKIELNRQQSILTKEYQETLKTITTEYDSLERLEKAAMNDLNIDYIQIAESVMYVHGNPYGLTDDRGFIADAAISDIANGCKKLKKEYFGNKVYSGYYQRCDCEYGYGPSHGGIRDEIGLKSDVRKRELTSDEKDACIYYLKNYTKINELKTA